MWPVPKTRNRLIYAKIVTCLLYSNLRLKMRTPSWTRAPIETSAHTGTLLKLDNVEICTTIVTSSIECITLLTTVEHLLLSMMQAKLKGQAVMLFTNIRVCQVGWKQPIQVYEKWPAHLKFLRTVLPVLKLRISSFTSKEKFPISNRLYRNKNIMIK